MTFFTKFAASRVKQSSEIDRNRACFGVKISQFLEKTGHVDNVSLLSCNQYKARVFTQITVDCVDAVGG